MSAGPLADVLGALFERGRLPQRIQRHGGALDGAIFVWSEQARGYLDDCGHAAPAFLVREDWGGGWKPAPAVQEAFAL